MHPRRHRQAQKSFPQPGGPAKVHLRFWFVLILHELTQVCRLREHLRQQRRGIEPNPSIVEADKGAIVQTIYSDEMELAGCLHPVRVVRRDANVCTVTVP